MNKGLTRGQLAGVAGAAVVACFFVFFISSNSVNFPVVDDYVNLVEIGEKVAADGWGAFTFANLSEQIFSHRPIAVRMAAALQVLFTGQLDFHALRLMGVLLQVATFAVVCIGLFWKKQWSGWWIVLLAILYLQPQLAGLFSMAMQGPMQLVPLAVAAAFAIRANTENLTGWALAWLLAFVALLAAINALLVAPLLVLWDVWQRRWKRAGSGVILLLCFAAFYFWDYQLATHGGTGHQFKLTDVLPGALVMLGGIFTFGPVKLGLTIAAGAVFLLLILWLAWSSFRKGDGFVLAMLLFLLGSVGMTALGRAGWGLGYMLQWRYTSLSLMLLLIVLGSALPLLTADRVRLWAVSLAVALFSLLGWWQFAPRVAYEGRELSASAMSWWLGTPAFFVADAPRDEAVEHHTRYLRSASAAGIYEVPLKAQAEALEASCRRALPKDATKMQYSVAVAGYLALLPDASTDREYVIFEQEKDGRRIVAIRAPERFAIGRFLRGERQVSDLRFCVPRIAPGRDVPPGTFFVP